MTPPIPGTTLLHRSFFPQSLKFKQRECAMNGFAVLVAEQPKLSLADWPKILFPLVMMALMVYFASHLARAWYETIRLRLWRSPHMNQLVSSTVLWVFFAAMGMFYLVQCVAAQH
ncbi:hypothetical protein A2454_00205 [Candidatus Peribacteria bacterium RIFOXYC2_FULL_55_14]|nr:MAG: hypothetical protein A2198_03005 [Candidatus Peribacteria bacterium RIFOXYA1_FULL_56_14]OGJ73871.1 MAG: hypothetical protein A2217_03975 [Candidatus Peribacteria bacterium RIFOXYA2_FULL_55_28]OGJ80295.1 MAG: hypothetical protein A2454_00205 [Candidatus Peribacteria bacterium RIFOXYC2_FULL_55_14]